MESSLELVEVPATANMVIAGATPPEILANAATIADSLKDLIHKQGFAVSMGKARGHVEVGGWQAAGAMLGTLGGKALHADTVWSRRVPRDDGVIAYESRCEIKTIDGEVVGTAESLCTSEERNQRGRDEYAIKGMAETRAESRAYRRAIGWVVSMAGFSPTPAEELPAESGHAVAPEWAAPMPETESIAQNLETILRAAGVISVNERVSEIGREIMQRADGTFPWIAAHVVWRLRNAIEENAPAFEDVSDKLAEAEDVTAEAVAEDNTDNEEK